MKLPRSIAFLPLLVLSVACGGGGNPAENPESDQPAATTQSGNETSQESTGSPATSASVGSTAPAGDAASSGDVGATFAGGTWTGGSVHVEMSGDATGSFDADLLSTNSITDGQSTTLYYVGAGGQGVGVAIYPDSWAISVTTADMTGGSGTTQECSVTYESAEDSNVAGTFSCPDSPVFTMAGAAGTVSFEGTFSATR